ncbi:DUF2155 domain-containing protein [Litorivita pollutaquae]|uniref:DUF2155 domain-containing protein n=1 Tax=Litorivita pollutaquae TaxID=2200892 RepID=A0A2V4MMB6_9RHOB|nr:DUF2155 domain-containing protein [Litorivita pollutaquae]PYC46739.1 DUF2155 domain-containing protein [Litorivita pollutaquae]
MTRFVGILMMVFTLAVAGPVAAQQKTTTASGAILRTLDKVSGQVFDHTMQSGTGFDMGRLRVDLLECRYPSDNPAADAFAHVTVRDAGEDAPVYDGWMVASSPALSALDHSRYDVWVIRCKTS